ncbi:helix-turn-helix domain-containing protein [Paenibacillus sp. GCM10012307]|uniref:Helix-turn-helix domain-containing protein n=1 Tax=Paenibacillus roseus TaxID=2798579 RepID=A0A934MU56_9BACL|nr:helix-turn-helix domain-containing protein [Paenibacillus roseus]MBJ6360747.1 helix-turn-helix domain-containing protein [Paenibacillus roseus]
METEDAQYTEPEDEFLELLSLAKKNDKNALLKLLHFFEEDMIRLCRFIRMPEEDALQTMTLEMIEVFKRHETTKLENALSNKSSR